MYCLLITTVGLVALVGCLGSGAAAAAAPASPRRAEAQTAQAPRCDKCRSNAEVVPIVYGKPGPGLLERANRGEIALGGCAMRGDRWHCKRCQNRLR